MFLKIIILFLKRVQIQLQSLLKPRQHWRLNICARNLRRGGLSTKTLVPDFQSDTRQFYQCPHFISVQVHWYSFNRTSWNLNEPSNLIRSNIRSIWINLIKIWRIKWNLEFTLYISDMSPPVNSPSDASCSRWKCLFNWPPHQWFGIFCWSWTTGSPDPHPSKASPDPHPSLWEVLHRLREAMVGGKRKL